MANDSCDGLSVTVWTGDRRRGEQLARRLEVGVVNTNDAYANLFSGTPPHGGWKESSIGARFGVRRASASTPANRPSRRPAFPR